MCYNFASPYGTFGQLIINKFWQYLYTHKEEESEVQ